MCVYVCAWLTAADWTASVCVCVCLAHGGGLHGLDGEAGEAGGVVVLLVAHQVRRRHVPAPHSGGGGG